MKRFLLLNSRMRYEGFLANDLNELELRMDTGHTLFMFVFHVVYPYLVHVSS